MPISKKAIQEKCKRIEEIFPARVYEIKTAIGSLEVNEFVGFERVQTFAKRLHLCRTWARFTVEDAAQALGVSHVTVLKYENIKELRSKIDKNYLELFSLIYGFSPLFLVGKTNNPFDYKGDVPFEDMLCFPPMQLQEFLYGSQFAPQSDIERCAAAIIDSLYRDFPYVEKAERDLMEILLKVGDAKYHRRHIIKSQLLEIPRIKKLFEADPKTPESQTINSKGNVRRNQPGLSQSEAIDAESYVRNLHDFFSNVQKQNDRHIQECYGCFVNLGTKDLELLQCFAKIAAAPPNIRQLVTMFLTEGGFLEDDYAFGQNDRKEKLQSYCDLEITFWHDD